MIQYELFPRYHGKPVWNSPFLQAFPAPGTQAFETFKVTELHEFKAYTLQSVALKDGGVLVQELDTSFPREFTSRSLDAFLDISGVGFGNWHLVQGAFLPDISRTKQHSFYLGTLDSAQNEVKLSTPEQVTFARVPFSDVIPYGTLLTINARHTTELFSKFNDQIPLMNRQELVKRHRHDEVPMPNAYIQVSDHVIGDNGNSKEVSVLIGYLKR